MKEEIVQKCIENNYPMLEFLGLGLADHIVFLVAFLGIIALIFWVFWVTIKLKD